MESDLKPSKAEAILQNNDLVSEPLVVILSSFVHTRRHISVSSRVCIDV